MNHDPAIADTTALARAELEELLQTGHVRQVSAASILCDEGQRIEHCYVVTQGTIEVARTIDGRKRALSQHGPGSILALMPALDGGPSRVSMRATEAASLIEIEREGLLTILDIPGEEGRYAALADRLTITAIRRLRRSTDELAQAIQRSLAHQRRGHMDLVELASIQARNHAWLLGG